MHFVTFKDYQEPPPPPPEPPPDDPPPEDPPLDEPPPLELLDELDDDELDTDDIVDTIKLSNDLVSNDEHPSYQSGACNEIASNFFIHLLDIPNT